MGFSFLTQELAIDLGTANTVIFQNDQIVLDEPSIVAIDNSTGKALALGQKAKLMQERENPGIKTVRPMKDGVIADFNAAEMMIRGFIKQVNSKRRSLFTPNIKMVVGIPSGSTEVEIRAVRDSSEHAGGRDVYLIYEPMASALGIGLDVEAPKGNMVVDIGGGTTEIAVISLGGIVVQDSIKVAGDVFTSDIQQYLRQQHNIRVGQITAEGIKIAIGAVICIGYIYKRSMGKYNGWAKEGKYHVVKATLGRTILQGYQGLYWFLKKPRVPFDNAFYFGDYEPYYAEEDELTRVTEGDEYYLVIFDEEPNRPRVIYRVDTYDWRG